MEKRNNINCDQIAFYFLDTIKWKKYKSDRRIKGTKLFAIICQQEGQKIFTLLFYYFV